MTKRVRGPNGQVYNFPDDTPESDMADAIDAHQATLAPQAAPSAAQTPTVLPNVTPAAAPSPAAAAAPGMGTTPDASTEDVMAGTALAPPPSKSTAAQGLRVFNNALTLGGWDALTGGAQKLAGTGSPAEERAKTAAAREAIGPIPSAALDVAGYSMGPGKLMAPLRSIGAGASLLPRIAGGIAGGAAEGGLAGGASATFEGKPLLPSVVQGATVGGLTGGVGGVIPPSYGKGPSTSGLQEDFNQAQASADRVNLTPGEVNKVYGNASREASSMGMSPGGNAPAHNLYHDTGSSDLPSVADLASGQTGTVSVKDAMDMRNRAANLKGDNAQYGDILNRHLDDVLTGPDARPDVAASASDYNNTRGMLAQSQALDAGKTPAAEPPGVFSMLGKSVAKHAIGAALAHTGISLPPIVGNTLLDVAASKAASALGPTARTMAQRRAAVTGTSLDATPSQIPDWLKNMAFAGGVNY
jgi:hypothetical protein